MARLTPRYRTRYLDFGPDRHEFRRKSVTPQVGRRIRLNLPDLTSLRTGGYPNSKTRMGIPPENFGHLALKFDECAGVVQRLGMRPMVCGAFRRISDQGSGYRHCYGRVPLTHDSANLAASYAVILPFLAVLCIFLKAHVHGGNGTDLVVLSDDIFSASVSDEEIQGIQSLMTIVDGEIVYVDEDAAFSADDSE